MMSWMLFGAGVVCTLMAVSALLIVWVGGWPNGTEKQRLAIIGWALLGAMGGMLTVIVSLAIGGPVGRVKANASRAGFGLEAEGHDDPPATPQAVVTTTTETKVPA